MRADRLISILMLLQTHGRMTARQLAEALEVSERTIYRDVEALSASGVPLYAEYGPGGGLALLDNYRSNLTGLNEDELRALFMVFSAPGPLDKLGISQKLKSAILKFSAELPDQRRLNEEKVRQRFYLDWSWWFHEQEPVPHLSTVQQAVWEERRLRLTYRTFFFKTIDVVVDPYALVSKAGIWYLVAGVAGTVKGLGSPRVYQITWLTDVELLDTCFERPGDFDLAEFWQLWCAEYEQNHQSYPVTLKIAPELLRVLPFYFGHRVLALIASAAPPDEAGWVTLTLSFESFENARERILGFGRAAEVLEPEALRCSVVDFAHQIIGLYEGHSPRS